MMVAELKDLCQWLVIRGQDQDARLEELNSQITDLRYVREENEGILLQLSREQAKAASLERDLEWLDQEV